MTRADWDILNEPPDVVSKRLLGGRLIRELPDGSQLVGRIIETEAYDQSDTASHSYKGRTPRTDVMFGPAGHLYVYFTYGMHYCCNVVTGPEGHGAAVLIRAVEPLTGGEAMYENRGASKAVEGVNLTNGPAKLCQAFGIDKTHNGLDLRSSVIRLELSAAELADTDIVQTTRVGISQAKDVSWRFYIRGNPYVSVLSS